MNVDIESIKIRVKKFYDVSDTQKLFSNKFHLLISYEIGGLVL